MAVNWNDPNEIEQFRQYAISKGKTPTEIDRYISKKSGGSTSIVEAIQKGYSPSEAIALEKAGVSGLPALPQSGGDLSAEEKKQMFNAQSGLRALTKVESILDPLPEQPGLEGKGEILQAKIPGSLGARTYKAAANEIKDVLMRLRTGAQINDQELKFYQSQLPGVFDNEEDIRYKLGIFKNLFSQFSGTLPEEPLSEPISINVSEGGNISIPGTVQNYVTKTDEKYGSGIEGKLLKFLVDSEFLPIAGSIIGGISGMGVGSIATGAAGAVTGKALQQGLRELFDPERQDLSDAARAVVTEGLVDAFFGGVFLGVGKVAGKAGKIILNKFIKEPAEAALPKLIRSGLKTKPSVMKGFKKAFGEDWAEKIAKGTIPASGEAALEMGEKGLTKSMQKLDKLLANKSVKTNELIKLLENFKEGSKTSTGAVWPAEAAGVNKIDEYINLVKTYGDEMPAQDVNRIKRELQESFGAAGDISSLSKKVTANASTEVRKFIEKFDKTGTIAGTNKEIAFNHVLKECGVNITSTEKAKALLSLTDSIFLASGRFELLAAVKAIRTVGGDPLLQARIIKGIIEYGQAAGDKEIIRNGVRLAMRLGIVFSANIDNLQSDKSLPMPSGGGGLSTKPVKLMNYKGLPVKPNLYKRLST